MSMESAGITDGQQDFWVTRFPMTAIAAMTCDHGDLSPVAGPLLGWSITKLLVSCIAPAPSGATENSPVRRALERLGRSGAQVPGKR